MSAAANLARVLLATGALLLLSATANAGPAGWASAKAADWQFIQQTGGLRLEVPVKKDGRNILPIVYHVQGTIEVTRKPTLINSGMAVRKITVEQKDHFLVLRVITQAIEKGSDTSGRHYADLSGIPAGHYVVYYESAGDPAKRLGAIDLP